MKAKFLWAIPGGIGIAYVLWQIVPVDGLLGHDFYHYFARAYLGALHFWQNGLAVPHYTASLCGGLPVFADPQSMYYSLPQWLTFVMDPLLAVLSTHLIFYCLGYWGFYRLLRDVLGAARELAHFGALVFILNGFSFEHLLVGHLTHHSYLLFPWWIHAIMRSTGDFWKRAGVLSLILIYTFYSGGTHIIVVFLAGGLLLLPWCVLRKNKEGTLKETALLLGISAGLVLAACLPKLAASASLSPSFLHRAIDASSLSVPTLLWHFLWFDPRSIPTTIPFGAWHFGPWEYVGFVSRLLMLGLPVLLLSLLVKITKTRFVVVLSYIGVISLIAWVGAAKHAEKGIWLLQDYHNPIKLYGAFIPFLIIGTIAAARWVASWKGAMPKTPWVRATLFVTASLLVLGEFGLGSTYFVNNRLVYGMHYDPAVYQALKKSGALPPVRTVTESFGHDVEGIERGETSLKCFEPMFGYRREVMKAAVQPGSTAAIRDDRFNLTHPGCLVYPNHFNCQRWDRIPKNEGVAFSRFIHGEAGAWGVPTWQTGLLRLGFVAFLTSLGFSLGAVSWFARLRKREVVV